MLHGGQQDLRGNLEFGHQEVVISGRQISIEEVLMAESFQIAQEQISLVQVFSEIINNILQDEFGNLYTPAKGPGPQDSFFRCCTTEEINHSLEGGFFLQFLQSLREGMAF